VSERYLARAQVVLACGERPDDISDVRRRIAPMTQAPVIGVFTKRDLASAPDDADGELVPVSAETGAGLTELLARIEQLLDTSVTAIAPDTPVVTRARHVAALEAAAAEMRAFVEGWEAGELPAPVIAVHLRAAVAALEELVGVVDTEDVLDRVFRSFCVGK
jgi:tRNA modification GTPase